MNNSEETKMPHISVNAQYIKDLSFENITLLNAEDTSVVSISAIRAEEEETGDEMLDESETKEPEVIGKGKSEEETEG